MRLQIAKLGMSKDKRTRDGARHFVTKITLPKAWDVAHGVGRVVGALGSEDGFAGSMLN